MKKTEMYNMVYMICQPLHENIFLLLNKIKQFAHDKVFFTFIWKCCKDILQVSLVISIPISYLQYLLFFYSLLSRTSLQIFIAANDTISPMRMFMISLYLVRSTRKQFSQQNFPLYQDLRKNNLVKGIHSLISEKSISLI